MKKGIVLLVCVFCAYAEAKCFVVTSFSPLLYGDLNDIEYVDGSVLSYTSSQEGDVVFNDRTYTIAADETVAVYTTTTVGDKKSSMKSTGLNCGISRYVSIELSYLYNLTFAIDGDIVIEASAEGTEGTEAAYYRDVAKIPYTGQLTVDALSGSVLVETPRSNAFSLIGHAGILQGKVVYAIDVSSIYSGAYLTKEKTFSAPRVGVGLKYQPHTTWFLRVEYEQVSKIGVVTGTMGVSF